MDVDVFRQMTSTLSAARGEVNSLQLNFRSQPPLIWFFNHLFSTFTSGTRRRSFERDKEPGPVGLCQTREERTEARASATMAP